MVIPGGETNYAGNATPLLRCNCLHSDRRKRKRLGYINFFVSLVVVVVVSRYLLDRSRSLRGQVCEYFVVLSATHSEQHSVLVYANYLEIVACQVRKITSIVLVLLVTQLIRLRGQLHHNHPQVKQTLIKP